eukprot:g54092.t1
MPTHSLRRLSLEFCCQKRHPCPGSDVKVRKKTLLHWGQRKLLICEIEFLTKFASPEFEWKVLYAGAAPGEHLLLLSELFPNCHFILVDPRPIFVLPSKSFTILKTYLNVDSLAKNALLSNLKTSSDRLLFISDIRSIDIRTTPDEQVENSVKEDMKLQMELHLALRPSKSILKFRLPYGQGRSKYLDGEVLLPVWGPQTTTESRLIPHGVTTKIWDHELYQNQMFYFNVTQRGRYYPHGVSFDDGGGLDHCYDCTAEIYILTEYLKQRSNTTFTVSTLSKTISSSLSCISNNDRTLADCQPPKPLVSSLRSSQSRDKDLKKQRLMNKKTLISNIAITTFIQQKRKTKPTIKQPFGLCPVDRPVILYYTILYYNTILYYTILYYTILYYTILYYTIYYTILYYTILYCIMILYYILYYIILYSTLLYYTILYYTILYYTILFCIMIHYTIYYTMLYSTLLYSTLLYYYTILYYTILYYTILYYTILYYTILYYTILYSILYYTILCYIILYYTILYYTILYYTILYYTILHYDTLYYILHYIILYSTLLYSTILYYTILYYTILYYTVLYYTILYYTVLYYTILYYIILYYTILYYTIIYYNILYYTILYYTILYYTLLYYTILHCITLYYTILYYTILHYTILYYIYYIYYIYTVVYYTVYDTILYYTILYYTILYYTILYYTILYYTIYYTILHYTILYYIYTILYYTILYYTILYYTLLVLLYYTLLY